MSLPLRECGLKPGRIDQAIFGKKSLPLRECGLKQVFFCRRGARGYVTPLAGVWIETDNRRTGSRAEIESLPLRECGLKQRSGRPRLHKCAVTPLAGVWIETQLPIIYRKLRKSLPLRECGLKRNLSGSVFPYPLSLPLRECGLKRRFRPPISSGQVVTPLAGVWIETDRLNKYDKRPRGSLPLRECGLKP